MSIKDYKELNVWQKGIEIVDQIYSITENFPQKESYGLSSQMNRAAISVPSNIAEGFARGHTAEYKRFLRIALGSCAELDTQLIIAARRKYITEFAAVGIRETLNHQSRMLMNLIKNLNKILRAPRPDIQVPK